MVYSQAKVIAGGLAHIPIVISVFYFIMISFNKRALEYAEANKSIKPKSNVLESKTEAPAKNTIARHLLDGRKLLVNNNGNTNRNRSRQRQEEGAGIQIQYIYISTYTNKTLNLN